jgi:hypothetical protein
MKSSIKISLAVAGGLLTTLGGVAVVADWRPFVPAAKEQALQRRISDLEHQLDQSPKIWSIGANGGG